MMGPDEINPGFSRVDYVPGAPCVGSKRQRDSVTVASCAISRVLGDDNLLGEILFRVGFLTTLVRSATFCRQWLRQASDPAFLRRFRKLHPTGLLGFYLTNCMEQSPRFVPMPMPLTSELADVIRRASFHLNTFKYNSIGLSIVDCWGGNVFVTLHKYDNGGIEYPFAVQRPLLCVQNGLTIFPPIPCHQLRHGHSYVSELVFREKSGSLSYLWIESTHKKATVHIYMLEDGVWCTHTTGTTEVHGIPRNTKLVLVDNKVYMCSGSYVLVFDLKTSSFSKIQYPLGVGFHEVIMSSPANDGDDDDSGVYLIHAEELQLDIWLHKGDNWLLVDTIYLSEMHGDLRMLHMLAAARNTVVRISQVGANAEFVFLRMGEFILYLDIKGRTLHKVYEMTMTEQNIGHYIHPFRMIWPPTFPALKDDPITFAFCPLDDLFTIIVQDTRCEDREDRVPHFFS